MPFVIPPQIISGTLGISRLNPDGTTAESWEVMEYDFSWEDCPVDDPACVTRDGKRTTRIGKAAIGDGDATVVVGFDEETGRPFYSVTVWGDVKDAITYCSFNFEEVQT